MDLTTNIEPVPVAPDHEFSLRSKFNAAERIVEAADSDFVPDATIKQTINNLQLCAKCVSVLALFSRNESLDDVTTASMPYLLIPAYLGFLTQRLTIDIKSCPEGIPQARSTIVSASLGHYRQAFKLFRDYEVPGVEYIPPPALTNVDEDGDDYDTEETGAKGGKAATHVMSDGQRREHNIKRHRRLQQLNDRIKHAMRGVDDESEEVRVAYTNKLEIWLIRSAEEFDLLSRESVILKSMQRASAAELAETRSVFKTRMHPSNAANVGVNGASGGANVVKLDASSYQSLLTPVRLLRFEEKKKVFGAGYPSLPKYTIEEYYDKMAREGKLPAGACACSGTGRSTRVEPSTTTHDESNVEEKKKARIDKEESDDDEVALQKARSWDEFKDDNPRGWGNRKNKG